MTTAYPLAWPDHIPRTKTREKGQFRTSLSAALKNAQGSLTAFGRDSGKPVSRIVLSSNVTLGVDRPDDPGVALWFVWDEMPVAIPIDRYLTPEANVQAIHHVIEARRTELRHGTLALVRASLKGFLALPSPTPAQHWWAVLEVNAGATVEQIEAAFKRLARERHPDRPGGSDAMMADLNRARAEGLKERGNG